MFGVFRFGGYLRVFLEHPTAGISLNVQNFSTLVLG